MWFSSRKTRCNALVRSFHHEKNTMFRFPKDITMRSAHQLPSWPFRLKPRATPRERRSSSKCFIEPLEDRVLPSGGALDPSFGTGGKVVTDFGGRYAAPSSMALESDG